MRSKFLGNVIFTAYGHQNVLGTHRSTLEITMEPDLTLRGDCIIGIRANQSAITIREKIIDLLKLPTSHVVTRFSAGGFNDEVRGFGSSKIDLSSGKSLVWRKSSYVDSRTIAIRCDKAARDLNRGLIKFLQDPNSVLQVVIEVSEPAMPISRTT